MAGIRVALLEKDKDHDEYENERLDQGHEYFFDGGFNEFNGIKSFLKGDTPYRMGCEFLHRGIAGISHSHGIGTRGLVNGDGRCGLPLNLHMHRTSYPSSIRAMSDILTTEPSDLTMCTRTAFRIEQPALYAKHDRHLLSFGSRIDLLPAAARL